jgi:hypothetical protein
MPEIFTKVLKLNDPATLIKLKKEFFLFHTRSKFQSFCSILEVPNLQVPPKGVLVLSDFVFFLFCNT